MSKIEKPDIFAYYDYRNFLRDWYAFLKSSKPIQLRVLSKKTGISLGALSQIFSAKVSTSDKHFGKLIKFIHLSEIEQSYLTQIFTLVESDTQEERIAALERLRKFKAFKEKYPAEIETHEYFSRWYYAVIREMAHQKGFKAEPLWIQKKLSFKVGLYEIKRALQFLIDRGYLIQNQIGEFSPKDKRIDCHESVYKVALTQFHHEMLELIGKSIVQTPSAERNVIGHTLTLSEKEFEVVSELLNQTRERISKTPDLDQGDPRKVYHVELAVIPLTESIKGSKEI